MKTGTVQLNNASAHIGYPQVIPPNKRGHSREITELFVPETHRGKGEATALLESICEQADQDQILLILMADTEKLESFYKRFDFVTIQRENAILMARQPIRREAVGAMNERQTINS